MFVFSSLQDRLLVGSDSSNASSWIFNDEGPWRFHFIFAEMKSLSSQGFVEFKHVRKFSFDSLYHVIVYSFFFCRYKSLIPDFGGGGVLYIFFINIMFPLSFRKKKKKTLSETYDIPPSNRFYKCHSQ